MNHISLKKQISAKKFGFKGFDDYICNGLITNQRRSGLF